MALVVFLRAVNLGRRTLRTKELATRLGLENVGAAGTFVAPGRSDPDALAQEVRENLPFETEVMVRTGAEIQALLARDPMGEAEQAGLQRFATVLARAARGPRLPLETPEGAEWQVRVVEAKGHLVLSLRCPRGPRDVYPNAVVERSFGVPATTRGWATLEAVGCLLRETPATGLKGRAAPRSTPAARSRARPGSPAKGRRGGAAAPGPRRARAGRPGTPRGGARRRAGE